MVIIGGIFTLPGDTNLCDAPGMSRNSFTLVATAKTKTEVWGTHNLDLCNKPSKVSQWQLFNSSLTDYTVPSEIVDIIGGRYVLGSWLCMKFGLTLNVI